MMIGIASRVAFQLKSNTSNITKLVLATENLEEIASELASKIEQAPNFFKNCALIIDLQKLVTQDSLQIDLLDLKKLLLSYQIIPLGVINCKNTWVDTIAHAGLYDLSFRFKTYEQEDNKHANKIDNKLIIDPIRSGQQIYEPNGDIIVYGHVSNGAELVASGNIHIYGNLRGRALAGINGNHDAKIFCLQLNAELIAIAGNYQVSENIASEFINTAVMVTLMQENLQFLPLSVTNKKD